MCSGKISNRYLNDISWQKPSPGAFALHVNEVHIWRVCIAENLHLTDGLSACLSKAEVVRANRYIHQKDRDRFIISRGMQRDILGRYLNLKPALLQFGSGDNKKPYVIHNSQDIEYNVSHSGNWILLTVSEHPVGCDVELIDYQFKFRDILPDHFSRDEIAYIGHHNATEHFFTLWTRKEALLKATGQGLGDHLKYTTALNGEHPMHPALLQGQSDWQVYSFNIDSGYTAAIATPSAKHKLIFWDIDS